MVPYLLLEESARAKEILKSYTSEVKNAARLTHSSSAATRPLPIERVLKSDILRVLALYQRGGIIVI